MVFKLFNGDVEPGTDPVLYVKDDCLLIFRMALPGMKSSNFTVPVTMVSDEF